MDSPAKTDFPLQRFKGAVFLIAVVIAIGTVMFVYLRSTNQGKKVEPVAIETPVTPVAEEPLKNKTDFGTNIPEDFPTNIPLEPGVAMTQSYRLDYPGEKQLTAVFVSKDTVRKNYDKYADFLTTEKWAVSNMYQSKTLSSLYALKDQNEINITITASEPLGSQVSVSVLKK